MIIVLVILTGVILFFIVINGITKNHQKISKEDQLIHNALFSSSDPLTPERIASARNFCNQMEDRIKANKQLAVLCAEYPNERRIPDSEWDTILATLRRELTAIPVTSLGRDKWLLEAWFIRTMKLILRQSVHGHVLPTDIGELFAHAVITTLGKTTEELLQSEFALLEYKREMGMPSLSEFLDRRVR